MPYDEKRNFVYEYVIKPVLENHPDFIFKYQRADESLTIGKISEEICESIEESDFVIADISEKNPNVFYELGYGHARSIKAILLIEKKQNTKLDIPFDIQDFRCHTYDFNKDGFEKIKNKLSSVLGSLLK